MKGPPRYLRALYSSRAPSSTHKEMGHAPGRVQCNENSGGRTHPEGNRDPLAPEVIPEQLGHAELRRAGEGGGAVAFEVRSDLPERRSQRWSAGTADGGAVGCQLRCFPAAVGPPVDNWQPEEDVGQGLLDGSPQGIAP